jgi:hypothetical protein
MEGAFWAGGILSRQSGVTRGGREEVFYEFGKRSAKVIEK